MANIRDLNHKISSLQNMQKVMRAMNMIATTKLRKLIQIQDSLVLFEQSVDSIEEDITRALYDSAHPLVNGYKRVETVHAVLFTGDKGLCGSHNNSVQKAADALLEECRKASVKIDFTCIGLKGAHYCRRKEYSIYHQTESSDRVFSVTALKEISAKIFQRFLNNEIQKLFTIHNHFVSTLHQTTRTDRLLPLPAAEQEGGGKPPVLNAVTEPVPEEFITGAASNYLFYKLRAALSNSYLSEQASRMTAMENATNNSEDLINRYGTLQNRARQASITNEIIEIVSGKEALKG